MEASRLLYASGVLAVATLGLIITCFIYGIGIAQYSELWALCIALWVLTNVSAFVTTVYVYDIKWDDSKMVSIMLALAGLFVVIVMLYVPISQSQSQIKLHRYRNCVYRELEGRYCNEFPPDEEDVTTLGAIGASVSSLMFIICALISFGYEAITIAKRDAEPIVKLLDAVFLFLTCGFYAYVGAVSTGFHATHCYDWWRMDVGAVRAFPYITAINVFSATVTDSYRNQVKWHSLSLSIPLLVYTFTKSPFWTETENTSTIVLPGIVFCAVSISRDVFGDGCKLQRDSQSLAPPLLSLCGCWADLSY